MTARGWLLVLFTAGLTVAANLLLRAGVTRAGGFAATVVQLPSALLRLAGQPLFDLGFILYALAALVWFQAIATQPLSTAYPLLVSITFLLVTLGAARLFHEPITLRKCVGLAVVLIGILIISRE
jgi:undecaprenyl phosphate-alpha-L-ara4N flippase subunit ArnE